MQNLDLTKAAYNAALNLWHNSGVERHAEGMPGVPGPAGDGLPWDEQKAYLDGAIKTLTMIRERLYPESTQAADPPCAMFLHEGGVSWYVGPSTLDSHHDVSYVGWRYAESR